MGGITDPVWERACSRIGQFGLSGKLSYQATGKPFPHLAVIAMRHVETQEVASVRRFAESKGHQFDPG
jgi:hypothetical protein